MKEIEHMNHECRYKHVEPGAGRGFSGRIVVQLSASYAQRSLLRSGGSLVLFVLCVLYHGACNSLAF